MSNAVIGALRVNLGMDSAEFLNGAKKAQGALSGLTSSIKGFAAGALAALSFGAVTASIKSAVDHMDELGKAAQKIGIPVEQLSTLEYAAKLADVSLGGLETSVTKFSRSLAEIANGGKNDAGAALRALGISATDAQGKLRPTTAIIEDVAAKFYTMKDGAEKTAIAVALFGKSGADMVPLLNGGKQALIEATAEAKAFGLVVNEQAAVAAEQFNDNLTRLTGVGQGLSNQITQALLPSLNDVTNAMADFVKEGTIGEQVAGALKFIMRETIRFIIEASAAWKEITVWITAAGQTMDAVADGRIGDIGGIWKDAAEVVAKSWENAANRVAQAEGKIQRSASGKNDLPSARRVVDAPSMPTKPGDNDVPGGANGGPQYNQFDHPIYGGDLQDWQRAMREMADAMEPVKDQAAEVRGLFQGWFDSAIQGGFKLKNVLQSLDQATQKIASKAFENAMGSLFSQGDHPLYGGGGLNGLFNSLFKNLPGFASGGTIMPGGHGGIDSQLVAFRKSPNERVDISKPGQSMGGGGSVTIVDQRRNAPAIDQQQDGFGNLKLIIRDMVSNEVPRAMRKTMPSQYGLQPTMTGR